MRKRLSHLALLLTIALCLSGSVAQAQKPENRERDIQTLTAVGFRSFLLAQSRADKRAGFALMPSSYVDASGPRFNIAASGPNLPVMGGGIVGRLTKWTGFTSTNSFIGNSTIFESKLGLVGIGTDTPTSRLTVAGMIESTIGGFKFPDGTVQATSADGALFGVTHDSTLVGDGTAASPLGVAVPLILTGAAPGAGVIQATNTGFGTGVRGIGGGDSSQGGTGVFGLGGAGTDFETRGGNGVNGQGGEGIGDSIFGGHGVVGTGGFSTDRLGGGGVLGVGGSSENAFGGPGVEARGGSSATDFGGVGLSAVGGSGALGDGLAGAFSGDVEVHGDLNVTGTKNFKIDHPLDPVNKYLFHAAIESAEVLNIYSGNARLDSNGEAIVHLPAWFQAINRDFRYSLTAIGAPATALYIAQEVTDNDFKIAGGVAGLKVSWQVTGVRSDPALLKHPFRTEQEKPERERGTYLNPEAYGEVEERGIEWSRNPKRMQQLKQQRIESKSKTQQ